MDQEHLVYRLNNDQILVEGASRSAIYDLARGYVFSINREAQDLLLGTTLPDENAKEALTSHNLYVSQNPELIVKPELVKKNLDFAWLEIEDRCNMRCVHCYGGFAPQADKSKPRRVEIS